MQTSRDDLNSELDRVSSEYDTGAFASHPLSWFGYDAALALRDHVVLHGNGGFKPL